MDPLKSLFTIFKNFTMSVSKVAYDCHYKWDTYIKYTQPNPLWKFLKNSWTVHLILNSNNFILVLLSFFLSEVKLT